MILKVNVKPHLKLEKEDKIYLFGEEFEVNEERGAEILKTTFNGNPVVEYVPSNETEFEQKIINLTNKIEELTLENENLKKENKDLLKTNDESTTNEDKQQKELEEDKQQKELEEDDNNKEKEPVENDKNKENKNKKESK